MTVYEMITNQIIERINEAEKNKETFRWIKPWTGGARLPESYTTEKRYSGVNLNLSPGEYITFKALQEYKGKVGEEEAKKIKIKKGSHKYPVYYFGTTDKKDADGNVVKRTLPDGTTENEQVFFLRYYLAFDIADIEGLPSHYPAEHHDYTPTENMEKLEQYITAYAKAENLTIDITPDSSRCFYRPSDHLIRIPEKSAFTSQYCYYSGICHELVHSTSKSMNRQLGSFFGSEAYSREELIGQIGSCMLCNLFGIVDDDKSEVSDNDIAYLQGWASYFKENSNTELAKASCQAQNAVQYFIETAERQLAMEMTEPVPAPPEANEER